MDMPVYPGDPQTPGVGAVEGVKLIPIDQVKTITKILGVAHFMGGYNSVSEGAGRRNRSWKRGGAGCPLLIMSDPARCRRIFNWRLIGIASRSTT